jgi:hypothetical protein
VAEPGSNPIVNITVNIKCLSLEEPKPADKNKEKGKGKRKKVVKWEQFWSKNLTVLILRSDGKLIANMTMPCVTLDPLAYCSSGGNC